MPYASNDIGLVLVLASGGIDSTACLRFYLNQQATVKALYIDYGQISARREYRAVSAICDYFRIPLYNIDCVNTKRKKAGMILGRNAFLLQLALMEFPSDHGIIGIGLHSGTFYYDCSPTFVATMQSIFDFYADGTIRIGAPFLHWTKADIFAYCRKRNIPLSLTYSCELGRDQPCGKCNSCLDLEALNALA